MQRKMQRKMPFWQKKKCASRSENNMKTLLSAATSKKRPLKKLLPPKKKMGENAKSRNHLQIDDSNALLFSKKRKNHQI